MAVALHPRRLIAGALVLLVVVHVGMSLGTSVRNRYGPAGSLGFLPRPLALSSELKRLGYMRDPFVFIRAIEAGTSEDSFIAVPKIYEGGFVEIVGRYYLYPRRLMTGDIGEAMESGASHIIARIGGELQGARPILTVSGEYVLYELPGR